jgi:hypothetical protein
MNGTRVTNPAAVTAGAVVTWLGTFKCCALPAFFSLLGLAGTTATLVAHWLAPGLALFSAALLARSFYSLYGLRRGTRASRVTTWVSAAMVVLFWSLRLAGLFNG